MNTLQAQEIVVQRRLDAYNKRDLAGWLSTYANARQFGVSRTHSGLAGTTINAVQRAFKNQICTPDC